MSGQHLPRSLVQCKHFVATSRYNKVLTAMIALMILCLYDNVDLQCTLFRDVNGTRRHYCKSHTMGFGLLSVDNLFQS